MPGSESQIDRFLAAWMAARQLIQAANFNRFHKAGLSATQFMALNLLPSGEEAIPIGSLARKMNIKPATIAQTINSLEERGLVYRERGEQDRRQVLIGITAKGARLQNAATGQFRQQMAAIFGSMDADKRAQLVSGLEQFVAAGQGQLAATPRPDDVPRAKRSSR